MNANELRRAFTSFFEHRGHQVLASASLVPNDPTLLFTVAGMVPFKPWFLGDEAATTPRATTVQKCLRAGGKHNDLDAIGTTNRHLTFFEMLGNFSFGDYFKDQAIPYAWELSTEVLGFDPERVWITVHESDDEAWSIWVDGVGVDPSRMQRMDEDNWWQMGDTGPCGPCSELYFDKGEGYGAPGGPAHGGQERYVEFWNLVFMQYNRLPDGSLPGLPRRNIDTGAGFERMLTLMQGKDSVFDTDVLRPILATAEDLTKQTYGKDEKVDIALRILADHARAMTFLVSDGIFPTNEGRGYVLRRIIRRAVLRASQLGVHKEVTPALIDAVVQLMGDAYPALKASSDFLSSIVAREEDNFRSTLRAGSAMLSEALEVDPDLISGDVAFRLHDTYGFPIDLTAEVAAERGAHVDIAGFEQAMSTQRETSRAATGNARESPRAGSYRELLGQFGPTQFVGYSEECATTKVVAMMVGHDPAGPGEAGSGEVEIFLERTPFYAEGGGQVGDQGQITASGLVVDILDTTAPLPSLHRHRGVIREGQLHPGMEVTAAIDASRRAAIRRNHTGTHLLHWALREVLGGHVRQHGSLVDADRLRFDFSHHAAPGAKELAEVEQLVNSVVLSSEPVYTEETTKQEAEAKGAIAFFGDRYGERVRMVSAGHASVELCGGTHVSSLGMIGPLKIVSEGSIGSNTRRVEAITGEVALARWKRDGELLEQCSSLLQSPPEEIPARIEELKVQQRRIQEQLKALKDKALKEQAIALASQAERGYVVLRHDGASNGEIRELALMLRGQPGVQAAVVIGSPDGSGVALVAAVAKGSELVASELIAQAGRIVGGGGGRGQDVAIAGGRDAARIEEALSCVREHLGLQ